MRWTTVCKAFLAWLAGLYILWLSVPIQPRLRFVTSAEQRLVGITADSRMLVTAGATPEGPSAVRGPIRRWDLSTGREDVFPIEVEAGVIRGLSLASGNQAVAYECSGWMEPMRPCDY